MTTRTVEELEMHIAEDIAWRKKELSDIKKLVQSASTSSVRRTALIRSGIAMLYAHWEGFVKNSSKCYLEFVDSRRLAYNQLSPNFVAIAMKSRLAQATQSNKASTFVTVCEFLLNNLDERCRLSPEHLIKTQGNLSSSVLKDIMLLLDLDYSFYETKEKFIDISLVKARNIVAHGNFLSVDTDEYLELFTKVLEMLEYYRNLIENAALTGRYQS